MGEFTLHSRLREDTLEVADLRLSRVLLMNDARFPWLVLVPRRIDVCELFDLKPEDRSALVEEIAIVAQMLQSQTNCIKVNIAALGNQVPQLHVHVIARF
ncbi:MAG: HIT domain-containing protein, partial [Alphaproteobacteria bacterium]|nr:HIT domain-containing protein [Alphaproteobacteria bacterium]